MALDFTFECDSIVVLGTGVARLPTPEEEAADGVAVAGGEGDEQGREGGGQGGRRRGRAVVRYRLRDDVAGGGGGRR